MVEPIIQGIIRKNPGEREFHQAVREVFSSLIPVIEENPQYRNMKILKRLAEPERTIMFRVPWIDDKGDIRINRGIRVEMSNVLSSTNCMTELFRRKVIKYYEEYST